MSTIAHVTFDLHDADSDDYGRVSESLAAYRLNDYLLSSRGQFHELPMNTFAGEYDNVRDFEQFFAAMSAAIRQVFADCEVTGRAFLLFANASSTDFSGYLWRVVTF